MLIDTILTRVSYALWSLTSIFQNLEIPEKNITITYNLYTPENPNSTLIENIEDININPEYDLKILCHGYYNYPNYSTEWYQSVVDEYMKKGATYVITTNYTYAIKDVKFYEMTKYAEHLGTKVGNFILELNKLKEVAFSKVHIIGHLLGAHVAGVAGETIDKETGKNIDRITGIDAVQMAQIELKIDGRLSRNDAKFVDGIHGSGLGYFDGVGRIDFFGFAFPSNCTYDWNKAIQVGTKYYASSINNNDILVGTKCTGKKYYYGEGDCDNNHTAVTAVLGEHVDREMFGKFYLKGDDMAKYVCKDTTEETTPMDATDGEPVVSDD